MNKDIIVLMLGYKSLAGKDTCAAYLKNYGYQRVALADKLKDTVAGLYGLGHEQIHGSLKDIEDKRYPNTVDSKGDKDYRPFLTPRRTLQVFGQGQRALDANIWARLAFERIEQLASGADIAKHNLFVITDFRFKNEYQYALSWKDKFEQERGASVYVKPIKIFRPMVTALSGANDISEKELDDFSDWCGTIINDGTVSCLEDRFMALVTDLHTKIGL